MYQLHGKEIQNERGAVIARLNEDGELRMAAGKKSQEAAVRAFLNEAVEDGLTAALEIAEESCLERVAEAKKEVSDTSAIMGQNGRVYVGAVPIEHVEPGQAQEAPQTEAEWQVGTIPENKWPPFSPQFGTATPGFREYVEKYNLNQQQVHALIKRICAKKGW